MTAKKESKVQQRKPTWVHYLALFAAIAAYIGLVIWRGIYL